MEDRDALAPWVLDEAGESAKKSSDTKANDDGDCMVRRQIASRIVVVGGLVCANVSGLFVEASSWP